MREDTGTGLDEAERRCSCECCWQQMKPSLVFSSLRLLFSLHYSPTGDRKAISKDMSAIGSDSWNAHFSLPSAFSSCVFFIL